MFILILPPFNVRDCLPLCRNVELKLSVVLHVKELLIEKKAYNIIL